jgi:uncharacterized protein (DUF1778 family)
MSAKRLINVRVTEAEDRILSAYAEKTGRSRTDILREFIRKLKGK